MAPQGIGCDVVGAIVTVAASREATVFGEWGFVLASDSVIETGTPRLAVATRYLTADTIPMHFQFDKDMLVTDAAVSTLDRPTILDDYLAGWQYYR